MLSLSLSSCSRALRRAGSVASSSSPARALASSAAPSLVLVERRAAPPLKSGAPGPAHGGVGLVTLNRAKALNALNSQLVAEIVAALRAFDADASVGAVVLTGSERAFAAGADIKEMAARGFAECRAADMFAEWADVARTRKPLVAAVNGFALGGGCELAMMCDVIYAGETAVFGQPEVLLGTIPGCGGTQRLVRAIGKSKAMEMVLSGDYRMSAQEALACGLVSRVLPPGAPVVDAALALAHRMAALSHLAVGMAKEAVNAAFESSLAEGVRLERRLFHASFATRDQKEGMAAFQEKRAASFKNE
jgi:enoyl-CoA hydratase